MAAAVIGFAGVANPIAAASSFRRRERKNLSQSRSALTGGSSSSELRSRASLRAGEQRRSRHGAKVRCVSISKDTPPTTTTLPLREIPGDYGLPFFGAFADKMAYYWTEKLPKFYENRRDKYKSTVYRMNTVPGPPGFPDPRVIILLDEKSFPILFDVSKVEKKDVFTGTYHPDFKYTGGYRVLPYLDPSEEKHALLKGFCFEVLKSSGRRVFPELHAKLAAVFDGWEAGLQKDGKTSATKDLGMATLRFIVTAFTGQDPTAPDVKHSLGAAAPTTSKLWLAPQILPIFVPPAGVPKLLIPLIELLIHTFPIPYFFVKSQHSKICDFFRSHAGHLLDVAESQFGLARDEALHNLVFYTIFNAWGGIDILFPILVRRVGSTSPEFQRELGAEVRRAIEANGGLNPAALRDMPTVQSAVWEALRIEPPVPFQYGRAKEDLIVESHEAAFQVKKGEMLAGYMPMACRDPKVFTDPDSYNPKRFLGDEGQKLVQYVLWSNGPETEDPTLANKQCPGKNFIVTLSQLFVAEIFSRFETIQVDYASGELRSLKRVS
uniref:Allene oxide synthase n=1 Tax=Marchantia polymorpha TaxID=3197 RepID=A0A0M4TTV7_MARPO|nr:allene oxide synthase [Marchantia polymorpha]